MEINIALIGLAGVIIGGVISIIGTTYQRKAESKRRRSERSYEEIKNTYISVLSFITGLDPNIEDRWGRQKQKELFDSYSKIVSRLVLVGSEEVANKFEKAFKSIIKREKDEEKLIADLTRTMQEEIRTLK